MPVFKSRIMKRGVSLYMEGCGCFRRPSPLLFRVSWPESVASGRLLTTVGSHRAIVYRKRKGEDEGGDKGERGGLLLAGRPTSLGGAGCSVVLAGERGEEGRKDREKRKMRGRRLPPDCVMAILAGDGGADGWRRRFIWERRGKVNKF
ncbi:hypothetical protein H5410_003510 [Solanum commersonii]|uniref:Uncharacterized protein n=1 Tax=Solanum commersonii TaxID=4109 RepID=A0A9J6B538_SOLCO|nr:hypothetical protein H5410_003510 [Solanum commersonii]